MEKKSRSPFRVVYQTPLFAYFEARPNRMDEYCTRFLTPDARVQPRTPTSGCTSAHRRRSPIPGTRERKKPRTPTLNGQNRRAELPASPSAAMSELQASASAKYSCSLSTARLCNSRSEFAKMKHLKQRLIAAIGKFGFPDEPDCDFYLVFGIFTAICEEFHAHKQRYGSKMLQSVAYHFKVLKRLQTPCLDSYILREYKKYQKTTSASILRSPRLVLQTVKMLDFEVYKRYMLNSGYQEVIDSMRARRKLRREQAYRASQMQQATKQLKQRPLDWALSAKSSRK